MALLGACAAKAGRRRPRPRRKTFRLAICKIDLAGSYDVTVRTGTGPSVRAEGPQNAPERLLVEVRGDQLRIQSRNSHSLNWGNAPPLKIPVTVPELQEATIAGSGTLSIDNVVADHFKATVAGSGDLALAEVAANDQSPGPVRADCRPRQADAPIFDRRFGRSRRRRAPSRDIELTIAGSGGVNANASGTVSGEIMGSGEARISGGATCTVHKMGSGSIVCS